MADGSNGAGFTPPGPGNLGQGRGQFLEVCPLGVLQLLQQEPLPRYLIVTRHRPLLLIVPGARRPKPVEEAS